MRIERRVKLTKQIKREVNSIIHKDFHFPLGVILTVTDVSISDDCRNCQIFYSVFTVEESHLERETARISRRLAGKAGYFKGIIGRNMRLKIVPDVYFKLDTTPVKAAKIDEIFVEISKENTEKNAHAANSSGENNESLK
ncbi:30S ribosome-binding factor RbfA [bacterium]|nr:30S ribosome-binding factor RbfA [bacterium]MBU3956001.1 30S ribosome-binding factor RbfA [bacterium]